MIIKYNAVKQAYLRLHPEHHIFFSGSTSDRAASEPFSAVAQQMSRNSSPTIPSTIDDELNTDQEIPNPESLYPYLFSVVPSFNEFGDVGSQPDGFPHFTTTTSFPNILQPLDHQRSNQINSEISSSSVETLALDPLPIGSDSSYYSYPASVSTNPGLRQASANNLSFMTTISVPNEVDTTVGTVGNHRVNPNCSFALLEPNVSHITPSTSNTSTSSSQQLPDQLSLMAATQSSHDITPSMPLPWAFNPLEPGFTMATNSSTMSDADAPTVGSSSSASLSESQPHLTDTWDNLDKLFRDFSD